MTGMARTRFGARRHPDRTARQPPHGATMLRTLIGLVSCTRSSFEPVRPETSPEHPETSPGPPASDCDAAEHVVLNEVSPADVETLLDVEGESTDWVELYNADDSPVDLSGWTLSEHSD